MKLKALIFLFLIGAGIFSCQKETVDNNGNNVVAAVTTLDVAYGDDPLQKLDLFLPEGRSASATKSLILIHGGAWATGDKTDFDPFIDSLKKRLPSYAIFNINYRLSGFSLNTFPTQEEDVKAAVNFINSKRGEYKVSDNVVLLGASAGGHLALLHAYKNSTPFAVKAVVDFFGPTDLFDLYYHPGVVPDSLIATIIGGTPATDSLLYYNSSPINFVNNACPTIILQGSDDPLVNPVTQAKALRDKLQIAGKAVVYKEYAGMGHGEWDTPTYTDAFNRIQEFLLQYNP